MSKNIVIAAQLSTVHSKPETLQPDNVVRYIGNIVKEVPIDILIIGWEEQPDLFSTLTSSAMRSSDEVFLWYPFLSDYPGFDPAHLVVNIQNKTSNGWGGYNGTGIQESFKQACPNNPEAVSTALMHLERMLASYEFDGVFIDKIRFPSMVNGLQDVFSCFCPHCEKKAARSDLDLSEVKAVLDNRNRQKRQEAVHSIPSGAEWLEEMLSDQPLLQQFIRFRSDSINQVVARISNAVTKIGKKMSLDVFSPSLAPLVGQDFVFMGDYAKWVKPMIYRFGNGPSSLRSEIPALINELGAYLALEENEVLDWVGSQIEELRNLSLKQIEKSVTLNFMQTEIRKAVHLFSETPVYLGLETVSIPGVMEIKPRHVKEILDIGIDAGVNGYVLSWDLLHTPIENVLPIKGLI